MRFARLRNALLADRPPAAQTRERYANPKAPAIAGLAVLAVFVAAVVLWSTLAPVSGAAIANGNLQVLGKRQTVQHPYGGVVKKLVVQEGQRVEKGQTLMTLFDSDPRAKLDVLIAEQDAARAQETRLIGERDAVEPAFTAAFGSRAAEAGVQQAIANETAILAARQKQFQAEIGVLRQKIAQSRSQIDGTQAQVSGTEKQRDLLQEELNGVQELFAKGFAPKTRILSLQRDMAGLEATRGAREADIARLKEEISQTDLEIAKAERARVSDITDQLRKTQSQLAELKPKLEAARDIVDRTEIAAPASGSVVGLAVFTEGGVIQPGAKLLDVVPSANPLMVEARLPLTDVSEVAPGRHADVRLTSVNRNERPTIGGVISTVSADRVTDDKSGENYYAVQVMLNEDDVKKSRIDLQPGMPAQVIVTTKPRTLVEYLVSPLRDEISGAFREK